MRRILIVGSAVLMSLALTANIALADACENASRPAPAAGTDTTRGNWIWLPSIGVPVDAWGFAVPGGFASTAFGFPGANGNFTNGTSHALLGASANCDTTKTTSRQSDNGIQNHECP